MSAYRDPVDGSEYRLDEPRWWSAARRPLWIGPGGGISPQDIETSARSLWRYRAALPIAVADPISLGEGGTPLVRGRWEDGGRPLFKLDFLNPTGSFKDRGSAVMLSYLRDRGVRSVIEDSSGNGGSSVAGYGAAGGMEVTIVAPASTSPAKIAQVRAYGARVELVDGSRARAQDAAIDLAGPRGFYAGHNWQAFFLQGTKTLAYELWEDLGFTAPDNVIVPVGAGSALLGCWLGFAELLAAGQIARMPRLFAAQPRNCSPVDASFAASTDQPVERPVAPTIAEGASIARPLRLAQMIAALRDSSGATVPIPEEDIARALDGLCTRGLFVEPTGVLAAAAYAVLAASGTIGPKEETVVLLSGSGLKAAAAVAEVLERVRR